MLSEHPFWWCLEDAAAMFGTAIPHTHERRYCPRLPDTAIDEFCCVEEDGFGSCSETSDSDGDSSLFTVFNENKKAKHARHSDFQIADENSEK